MTEPNDSAAPAYTADQLHQGVLNAIAAKDLEAAVAILEALAVVDLNRAAELYQQIKDSLVVARFLNGAG